MTPRTAIPRGVWVLGFVSLFMDISSEMIHSLAPVFMTTALGASALAVGLVEGVAEATALIVKVFSGTLSDHLGKRKGLAVLGYGLGALSKPLFAIATAVPHVLLARFADRIGKGIRGAPRDALIADLTPPAIRGAAYGLRQALDTAGAFVGPLLAIVLMLAFTGDFRRVFWIAVIPGAMSVLLLAIGVREPEAMVAAEAKRPLHWEAVGNLGRPYFWVVGVGAILTLARFSEAFLILRAQHQGLSVAWAPAVLVLMNAVFALGAFPAGRLADRLDRRYLLAAGLAVLIASDLLLAFATGLEWVAAGVALWGLHMALTQGLFAAMVADTAPPGLRGTAFGLFNLGCGVATLVASALAGFLWMKAGPEYTFLGGAAFSAAALVVLHNQACRG